MSDHIHLSQETYADPDLDRFDLEQLQSMSEDEIEHIITQSCLKQKKLEYDKKIITDWFKNQVDATKEVRENILSHLKTRREADAQARSLLAISSAGQPASLRAVPSTP